MKREYEMDPLITRARVNRVRSEIIQPDVQHISSTAVDNPVSGEIIFEQRSHLGATSEKQNVPLTQEEKKAIVTRAYAEGYFRVLPEEQKLFLGYHFLELGSEDFRIQNVLASKLGMTKSWISLVEKKAIEELSRFVKLLNGEEVDEEWRDSLKTNREALSYLYSRFRTHRSLARVLGVKHREMPDILRSQGINMHPGHPSLDLYKVFGNDPKGEITRLRKLGYTIERLAWLFCISDRTMKNVIKNLGLQDVKPDK